MEFGSADKARNPFDSLALVVLPGSIYALMRLLSWGPTALAVGGIEGAMNFFVTS